MHSSHNSDRPRRIGALVYPRFSNHCLANAIEPLRAANMLSGRWLYDWQFLSLDGGSVPSSSGLQVVTEARLSDASGDLLMVLPSYAFEGLAQPRGRRALRAAATRYGVVAGLDTGSWLLADAGLLDGQRATIHWDLLSRFSEQFPEVEVVEDRVVHEGLRWSCGGALTAFELMLDMIGAEHGPALRHEVAQLFMYGERQLPGQSEGGGRVVDAAMALMRRHLEVPLKLGALAARLGISQRRLSERFAKAFGQTPQAVYTQVRLGEARRLLRESHHSVAEIALRCGYADASAMTRAYRRAFGVTPRATRSGS